MYRARTSHFLGVRAPMGRPIPFESNRLKPRGRPLAGRGHIVRFAVRHSRESNRERIR
jgi:hypothetical protein